MRLLVWQWGRRGAGPRYATELAAALREQPDTQTILSLSAQAEILATGDVAGPVLPYRTYDGVRSLLRRLPTVALELAPLAARLRGLALDAAVCAMPAYLDALMVGALRRAGVPFVTVVHDADPHPGDSRPFEMALQRRLVRRSAAVVTLSDHVAARLRAQGVAGIPGTPPLFRTAHPPLAFGQPPAPPGAHGDGVLRLLSFGRLLPYKGLDLLADAMRLLGPRADLVLRVVGQGPETTWLDTLRRLPGVTVENRWVPEIEVGHLLGWSDAVVLSHREASQSGVAAAGLAAGRHVIATDVGGLREQLAAEPLARLCPPTAEGLAAAIRALLAGRTGGVPRAPDPSAAWKNAAAGLIRDLNAVLAARP